MQNIATISHEMGNEREVYFGPTARMISGL
jgi:hypothetical protein